MAWINRVEAILSQAILQGGGAEVRANGPLFISKSPVRDLNIYHYALAFVGIFWTISASLAMLFISSALHLPDGLGHFPID